MVTSLNQLVQIDKVVLFTLVTLCILFKNLVKKPWIVVVFKDNKAHSKHNIAITTTIMKKHHNKK